jgi:hypothetical protein
MAKIYNSAQEVVNDWFKRDKGEGRHKPDYFHASSLGSCKRKQIWGRMAVPATNPLNDRVLRVFGIGEKYHEWFESMFEWAGVLIAKEQEVVNEKYNYKGHFDALVNFGGKNVLFDFKSQHSESFHYLEQDGIDEGKKLQIVSYAIMGNLKVDECRILFISKDDLCLLEYKIPIEPYRQKVIDELVELNKYFKAKKIPEALPELEKGRANWQCRYCAYLDKCRGKDWVKKLTTKKK